MGSELYTKKEPIKIQMFGGFRITVGDATICDTDTRTRQLWHLLQYLIAFRDKTVSQEEIIKVMWPENDIENPANALKNLVYRIRVTFKNWGIPYAQDMIIYNRGSYQWNNNLPCLIDVEEFERQIENAKNQSLGEEYQIEEYRKAIELYRGDFLPSSSSESWVIPISSYLRTLFFRSVYSKLDILKKRNDLESLEKIVITCKKTLIMDSLEEAIHRHLISALHGIGKQREALEHFNIVTEQFYRELGMGPSDEMHELYKEISKTTNSESDIIQLQEDLRERTEPEGAFYCEYEVFKNLYRLEARTAARTGTSMFVSMITIDNYNGKALGLPLQTKAMETLRFTIQTSLRKGDVFSRFSPRQHALLLSTGTKENGEMVMNRIIDNFKRSFRNPEVVVHAKLLALVPAQ